MNKHIIFTGNVIGTLGCLICAIAGLSRMLGYYYVLSFQSTTLFTVGVGMMVFSCMVKLEQLLHLQRH